MMKRIINRNCIAKDRMEGVMGCMIRRMISYDAPYDEPYDDANDEA
jgi:hypothetical protein